MKLKDLEKTVRIIAPAAAPMLIITGHAGEYPKDENRAEGALAVSLEEAEEHLAIATKATESAKSDLGYWSNLGVQTGWQVAVNLLKAAQITGPDNLPDIPPPDSEGHVVMDAQGMVTDWSWRVLAEARQEIGTYKCDTCGKPWPVENEHKCDGCGKKFCVDHCPKIGCHSYTFEKYGMWCTECYKKVRAERH